MNLYEKVVKENKDFISKLKTKSPEEIIETAYEVVVKDHFVNAIEVMPLSEAEKKALLEEENTLDYLYEQWMDRMVSFECTVEDAIKDAAVLASRGVPPLKYYRYTDGKGTAITCMTEDGEFYADISINLDAYGLYPFDENCIYVPAYKMTDDFLEVILNELVEEVISQNVKFGYATGWLVRLKPNWKEICEDMSDM